jgi:7,8-dihydroneopterin aldolase/epimerase/oxygenase
MRCDYQGDQTMDRISIKGMQFWGYHGVLEQEKSLGQRFTVDAELFLDLSDAGKTDSLEKTVSYADIFKLIEVETTTSCYDLIERLCYRLVGVVLAFDERIKTVQITISKPQAPIVGMFETVAVTMKRDRNEINLSEFRI